LLRAYNSERETTVKVLIQIGIAVDLYQQGRN